jgi:hypothetical protein
MMPVSVRFICTLASPLLAGLLLVTLAVGQAAEPSRPNIVFILADDK